MPQCMSSRSKACNSLIGAACLFQGARITLWLRYWVLISPYGCMKDMSIGASPTILSHSHWTAFKETSSPCSVTYASKLGSADQISLRLLIGFPAKRSRLAPSSATEYRPRKANFVADYLAGRGSAFLLHRPEAVAAFQGITEQDVDPPYELLLQHNASIFGKHAAGKTILVLREVPACSAQALSDVVPQVDEQTQRLLCDLALATQKFSRCHVVEYVTAATNGQGRLYAKQSCAQYLPKSVRAFIYAQTHQEVDMTGAHYELIRRYVNSSSLPHIELLRFTLASIWGEDACVGGENIIKMFPVRVINAGAPATLRFLQQHGFCPSRDYPCEQVLAYSKAHPSRKEDSS